MLVAVPNYVRKICATLPVLWRRKASTTYASSVQLELDHVPFKVRTGISLPWILSSHKLHHCSSFPINKFRTHISLRSFSPTTRAQHWQFCSQFLTMSLKSSPESSAEYRWVDGVECLEMYQPGGYHPVMIDDLLHDRYLIQQWTN